MELGKPQNRTYLNCIRTAFEWGKPPTFIIKEEHDGVWTKADKILALGYQMLQDSNCTSCGVPYWYGHSTDDRLDFMGEIKVCYSCREQSRLMKNEPSCKDLHDSGGTLVMGVYPADKDEELISPQEAFKSIE